MGKRRKIFLWLGLVLSVPASAYGAFGFVYYSWLGATESARPAERAGVWAGGAAILTLAFLLLFVYCLVSLVGEATHATRTPRTPRRRER